MRNADWKDAVDFGHMIFFSNRHLSYFSLLSMLIVIQTEVYEPQ